MSNTAKIILAIVCLAVAGLVLFWALSGDEPSGPGAEMVTDEGWVCEACKATFGGPITVPPRTCPTCGKVAGVLRLTFKCGKCGEQLEAGWTKLTPEAEEQFRSLPADQREGMPMNWELPTVTRKPGADGWTAEPITPTCPKCGNTDRRTLKQLTP